MTIVIGGALSFQGLATGGATVPQNNCAGTPIVPYGRTECRSSTCTIIIGATICSAGVAFSPAFTTAPTPPSGWVGVTLGNPGSGTVNIVDASSYTTWTFISPGNDVIAGTWTSMPAAQTEIFGDALAQHELIVNWGNQTQADFGIACPTASNTAGATLTVQYSPDLGATWTSITGLSINVNANCGLAAPMDSCYSASGTTFGCYVNIPVGAQVNGLWLRIVGSGGGGVGDNPVFTEAYVITHTGSSSLVANRAFSLKILTPSTTSVNVSCQTNIPPTLATVCPFTVEAFSAVG